MSSGRPIRTTTQARRSACETTARSRQTTRSSTSADTSLGSTRLAIGTATRCRSTRRQVELWVTEQGPNGGDEINILKPGANYGWPFVSNGRNYMGPKISDAPDQQGTEQPHVVWVPSIAVTAWHVLHGRRLHRLEAELLRRRTPGGRDTAHRAHAAHRVQRASGKRCAGSRCCAN